MANRALLYKYRGDRCSHCGKSVNEMVARYGTFNRMFEFHHADPGTKHVEYQALMKRAISTEQIEEVDKCMLLCRDCHGIVHSQNIEGSIEIQSTINGRVVSQQLHGWFVVDNVDRTMRFMSNDRNMLQPCRVTLGDGPSEDYFVLELVQEHCLLNWFKSIADHKRIEVISLPDGEFLLEVYHETGNRVQVRMALGLPIFTMNFEVSEGNSSYLWLRNGMVLTKEGDLYSSGEVRFPINLQVKS
ncbi:hypothetical protein [Shewanella sp.]|uniref:hypothetical protein n=1 Tax=Shewanella sp. TaxID=50422 RepID=UPI00262FBCFA|nr:hypothetical protein [Shewanella sp.]